MNWLAAPLALVAALAPAGAVSGTGAWRQPIVQPARPLLDGPEAVRPAMAAGPTGVTALAFVADTTRGARMAVALRRPGARSFLSPRTLPGTPDLNDAGGRAPAVAAGPRGFFAVAWLARSGARRVPIVVVSIRRPGRRFGPPRELSQTGGRPLAAPPAVALDRRGTVTVAWTEQRRAVRRVVAVRIAAGGHRGRSHELGRAAQVGPAAAAGDAVAWTQAGRARLWPGPGLPSFDLGAARTDRAPALASSFGRVAIAWLAGPGLMVRDPAGAMSVVAVDGDLSAGPELGLDGGGQTTLAWQDARGVLGLTSGGRPQVVGSVADNATLSTLSVSSDGRGILSFVASAARPDGNGDGGPVVRVAGRPVGRGFLAPVTLSKPGPLISLVAAAAVPGGSDAVSWATSIGAPRAGLLFVSTRSPGRLAGAALAPAVAVSEPGLIA